MRLANTTLPSARGTSEPFLHVTRNTNYVTDSNSLRISIITVTFNSSKTIRETLECVKRQTFQDVEHIIIDGLSTDNTMDIVKEYPNVKWVSEKDSGLYHAMNKGISMATGDVIGILNSDDVFAHDEVLEKMAALFNDNKTETAYGDLQYVSAEDTSKVVRYWKSGKYNRSNFRFGWMPPHPTFFVRRQVYEKTGLFNLSLKSASDYELMLRILFKHNCTASYLPEVVVKMRSGGVSNRSLLNRLKGNLEDRAAWHINGLKPFFFTLYLKPARKIFQFIKWPSFKTTEKAAKYHNPKQELFPKFEDQYLIKDGLPV